MAINAMYINKKRPQSAGPRQTLMSHPKDTAKVHIYFQITSKTRCAFVIQLGFFLFVYNKKEELKLLSFVIPL